MYNAIYMGHKVITALVTNIWAYLVLNDSSEIKRGAPLAEGGGLRCSTISASHSHHQDMYISRLQDPYKPL